MLCAVLLLASLEDLLRKDIFREITGKVVDAKADAGPAIELQEATRAVGHDNRVSPQIRVRKRASVGEYEASAAGRQLSGTPGVETLGSVRLRPSASRRLTKVMHARRRKGFGAVRGEARSPRGW